MEFVENAGKMSFSGITYNNCRIGNISVMRKVHKLKQ